MIPGGQAFGIPLIISDLREGNYVSAGLTAFFIFGGPIFSFLGGAGGRAAGEIGAGARMTGGPAVRGVAGQAVNEAAGAFRPPPGVANVAGGGLADAARLGVQCERMVQNGSRACFAAATKFLTPVGPRAIESLKAGDLVLARAETDAAGPVEPKLVEETFNRTGRVWHLHVGGKITRTSGEHPFYVHGQGWVEANRLLPGDLLSSDDGQSVAVEDVYDTGEYETLYNIRVADYHTYFVSDEDWGFSVWAHNTGPCGWFSANEAMSSRASAYQTQITGRPGTWTNGVRTGDVYYVNGVKFDGVTPGGVLLDAKANYAQFVMNGRFRSWFSGRQGLIDTARRQLAAAGGTPITWHVAEAEAATAMRNLLADEGITGITIIHTPAV